MVKVKSKSNCSNKVKVVFEDKEKIDFKELKAKVKQDKG